VCALGNAKNRSFERQLAVHDVEVFDDALAVIRHGRARGARIAVVSPARTAGRSSTGRGCSIWSTSP
jgi:hypothetical protein